MRIAGTQRFWIACFLALLLTMAGATNTAAKKHRQNNRPPVVQPAPQPSPAQPQDDSRAGGGDGKPKEQAGDRRRTKKRHGEDRHDDSKSRPPSGSEQTKPQQPATNQPADSTGSGNAGSGHGNAGPAGRGSRHKHHSRHKNGKDGKRGNTSGNNGSSNPGGNNSPGTAPVANPAPSPAPSPNPSPAPNPTPVQSSPPSTTTPVLDDSIPSAGTLTSQPAVGLQQAVSSSGILGAPIRLVTTSLAGSSTGKPANNGRRSGNSGIGRSLPPVEAVVTQIVERIPGWLRVVIAALALAALALGAQLLRERHGRRRAEVAAGTDALTGIANRSTFEQRLDHEFMRAKRHGRELAVMLIDVDRFKQVNDSLGHPAGDRLLCEISARLVTRMRETDLVARIGGDEFAVVCPETGTEKLIPLRDKLETEITESLSADVGLSIGTAEFQPDDTDPQAIVARADQSMYRRKRMRSGSPAESSKDITAAR